MAASWINLKVFLHHQKTLDRLYKHFGWNCLNRLEGMVQFHVLMVMYLNRSDLQTNTLAAHQNLVCYLNLFDFSNHILSILNTLHLPNIGPHFPSRFENCDFNISWQNINSL